MKLINKGERGVNGEVVTLRSSILFLFPFHLATFVLFLFSLGYRCPGSPSCQYVDCVIHGVLLGRFLKVSE